MVSSTQRLHVLSMIPARVRLHLPGWPGADVERIENRLRGVKAVESVQANPLTGNALIHFDRRTRDEKTLLEELQEAWDDLRAGEEQVQDPVTDSRCHRVGDQKLASSSLLRAGVRGLLGHAVLDSLWFAGGFLGEALGLPLAGLGPLHLLMDVGVWLVALGSANDSNSGHR